MSKPKGHKDDCNCAVCWEIRHKGEKDAHTLKEIYWRKRNGSLSIFGSAWQGLFALLEWLTMDDAFGFITEPICKLFAIHFSDGYALILCSIPVLVWWIVCSALFLCVFVPFIAILAILWSFFIPIGAYSLIFELPASIINQDLENIDKSKVNKWR